MKSIIIKTIIPLASILLLFTIVQIYQGILLNKNLNSVKDLESRTFATVNKADELKFNVVQVQQWLTDISATRAAEGFDDGFEEAEKYAQNSKRIIKELLETNPDKQQEIKSIENSFVPYYNAGKKMAQAYIDGGPSKGNEMMDEFDKTAEAINSKVEKFKEDSLKDTKDVIVSIEKSMSSVLLIMLLSITAGILITAATVWFIFKMVTKPIVNIVTILKNISKSEGDLTKRILIQSKDEIGELASAVNEIQDSTGRLIKEIRNTAETMSASSQEMSAITEQIASSSQNQYAASQETLSSMEELDAGIQNISKNVQEVSMNIFEVTKLVENMEKSVDNVSASINCVNNEAQNTIKATESSRLSIEKSRDGMYRINQAVGNLVSAIKGLGKSAVEIGDIVDVIDDIAEQTNLLALNAAIEAARAGEHGKGFAVVAGAIRNLAEKSGKATKEITKLIRGIQDKVSQAVETAKEGALEVEHGVSLAKDTENALAMIKEAVDNTANEVRKVSALTEQQEKEIKEIVKASENINDLSQIMAATVQEQTAASSEVVKAIENVSQSANQIATGTGEIASSTEGLARAAQKMSSTVAKFKI